MVNKDQVVVAGTIGLIAVAIIVGAVLISRTNLGGSGTIVYPDYLVVYGDEAKTKVLSAIDWGSIGVGQSSQVTIWVQNNANFSVKLGSTTSAWLPSGVNQYLSVSFSSENFVLSPHQSVAADLTLTVSPSISGVSNFSNTITISGTQLTS